MLSVVNADGSTHSGSLINESVREGARRMPTAVLEAEVNQYIAELAAETDKAGRRLIVPNGHHRPRTVITAAGPVRIRAPRVNDRHVDLETGKRRRFSSKILPPWRRKSPKVSEVLPLLHLYGLSTGAFAPAPEQFLGSSAGLSWKALAEVFPGARQQRCRVHKVRNVTNALPKSAQPGAVKAMQEIHNTEDRAHTEQAIEAFSKTYGTKWPKAVAEIVEDRKGLLTFYDFPAEHRIHLRTTNPIESAFSAVRLRTKVTRGAGSPAAALATVFKPVESAQARRRAITGARLVPLVRAGARFENRVRRSGPRRVPREGDVHGT
ncbi:transposase [Streptomyces sp. NPDC059568]|uniref:transposase n=1 Tax=Streptomyces sp. NPDC059568 TaxID=3346868 RepID=UPI0036BD870E